MNKLKKVVICVIVEFLLEEEIVGLCEMFKMIDMDYLGVIMFEELKSGLECVGLNLVELEIW